MDGRTSQKAAQIIGSRFELVLVATTRARELERGSPKKVDTKNSVCVTALQEIEQGKVGREYLNKVRSAKKGQ